MKPERPAAPARIALVGEAPGEQEALLGRPFVGPAGMELNAQLRAADMLRSDLFLTNVFADRPEKNEIENFCYSKDEQRPATYSLPALRPGKYVREEIALPALERLRVELEEGAPNALVVALGNVAMWALCARTGIGGLRGTPLPSTLLPGRKVLPTYHPAAVLRDHALGAIAILDLLKAKREAEFPEIRRPARTIMVAETPADLESFPWRPAPGGLLSWDVETSPARRILLCVGFSPAPDLALVIPLVDRRKPDFSYWAPEEERLVWRKIKAVMEDPSIPKVGQNGAYDYQWMEAHGVRMRGWRADTMIAHHALYPELQKGLGFLGSIYTDEPAWKLMRPRGQQTGKREDT